MYTFRLQLRMMLRRFTGNALMLLLLMATTLFLLLYPGFVDSAEKNMAEAGAGITVNGWMYHSGGDQTISMSPDIRDALMNTGYIKHCVARSTVEFYALAEMIEQQGVGDTSEERRAYILNRLQSMGFVITAAKGTVYGVNDLSADPDLLSMEDQITWLAGYDASCLAGAEPVCLYPMGQGVDLGDAVEILLHQPIEGSQYDLGRELIKLKVVGTFRGNPANPVVYCPLAVIDDLLRERGDFAYDLDRFLFVVGQNDKLPEIKDFFVTNGLHQDDRLRVAIDDRQYEKAMAPLEKNLRLLQGLQPVLYALVILLGFFLCFLVARRRKPEYAVMRMLGETAGQVVLKALAEQLILCVIGVALGAGVVLICGLGQVSLITCGGVLLCYSIGSALAVLLMVRVNVMEILRDKE